MCPGRCRVTVDDKDTPVWCFSLSGQPDDPGPGDLIVVDRVPAFVLGQTRTLNLRDEGSEKGFVLIESGGSGENTKIACRVGFVSPVVGMPPEASSAGDRPRMGATTRKVLVNPLAQWSAIDVAGLRGLKLEIWNSALEACLEKINPEHCALSIDSNVLHRRMAPPVLPSELRYLVIELRSGGPEIDFSTLSGMMGLRVLLLFSSSMCVSPSLLDLGLLRQSKCLRVLHARGAHLSGLSHLSELRELRDLDLGCCEGIDDENVGALGTLHDLRRLNLSRCGKLTTIEFTRSLSHLEFIDVSMTGVSDLSVLGELPSLREIVAYGTPTRVLPKGRLPQLRLINILNSQVAANDAAQLQELCPDAMVRHCWAGALRDTVAGADHVRVRSGGIGYRHKDKERTLAEEWDATEVEQLAWSFEVNESKSGGSCKCFGHPTVEFHRGEALLAEIGLKHGWSACWVGWPGDARLTLESRDKLAAWLSEHGERSFLDAHQVRVTLEKGCVQEKKRLKLRIPWVS
jgi:hypothetical protein